MGVPDLTGNRISRNVWILSIQNGGARALTTTGRDSLARWAPDGRRIAFVSVRDGTTQLYTLNVDTVSEPIRLTKLSGGIDNIVWSRDGRTIAFTSEVYTDCQDDACNVAKTRATPSGDGSPRHSRTAYFYLMRHPTG